MPKKSREQKRLADIRRRVRTERVLSAPASAPPVTANEKTFRFTATDNPKGQEAISGSNTELTAIKKDLTKTVALAIVAIMGELVLFWFERR